MRAFWQSIALLLLVAFAPASVHCLAAEAASCAPVVAASCEEACHHEGDPSPSEHSEHDDHDCPTETLAKSQLPGVVIVPNLPCHSLDHLLATLSRAAAAARQYSSAEEAWLYGKPKVWIATWVFASRSALPPRSPSDLV
jgi:hypothetical protein